MRLNNKGFTLVELLAAVVIITLLMVIVVPSALHSLNTGKDKSYEILVKNIVIASKELYEEVYGNELLGVTVTDDSGLFKYNSDGTKSNENEKITFNEKDESGKPKSGKNNSITVNLQTLVSNGFLTGTNETVSNGITHKVILNPNTNPKANMGGCIITITRSGSNGNATYSIIGENDPKNESGQSYCPTTDDYKKGVS